MQDMQGGIWLGDLLQVLARSPAESETGLAAALGFAPKVETPAHEPLPVAGHPTDREIGGGALAHVAPAAQGGMPRAVFLRVLRSKPRAPDDVAKESPPGRDPAEVYNPNPPRPVETPAEAPPEAPPLMPWPRLWPLLKRALGNESESCRPDIPRIVETLACGRPLSVLPGLRHKGWAGAAHLVLDLSPEMQPFWRDAAHLRARLRRLRGDPGLRVFVLADGDPRRPQEWLKRAGTDGDTREMRAMPAPPPGARVLVLSHLGCGMADTHRRGLWARFASDLVRRGIQPTALMPLPPRCWDGPVTRWFAPVCWVRQPRPSLRLRRGGGPNGEAAAGPRLSDLLALLSPASRIEPELLRAARCLLPPDRPDVGEEFAAWSQSDLLGRGHARYFDPLTLTTHRERFERLDIPTEIKQAVPGLLHAYHRHLSPAIEQEEQSVCLDLLGGGRPLDGGYVWGVVNTLLDPATPIPVRQALQAWVARLSLRLHPRMWCVPAFAALWAAANIDALRRLEIAELPRGLSLDSVNWMLRDGRRRQNYVVTQCGESLVLGNARTPGSPLGEVQAVMPGMRLVALDETGKDAPPFASGDSLPVPASGRYWLKTDEQQLLLESVQRPVWARAMGRDARGLFARPRGSDQRLRWRPPGEFGVRDKAGKGLGKLRFPRGCWQGEAATEALEEQGFKQPDWAHDFGVDEQGCYAGIR